MGLRKITPEQLEKIKSEFEIGKSATTISNEFKLSLSYIKNLKRRFGIKSRVDDVVREAVLKLHGEGIELEEIAFRMKRNQTRIRQILIESGHIQRKYNYKRHSNADHFKFIRLLLSGAFTVEQLVELSGFSEPLIRELLNDVEVAGFHLLKSASRPKYYSLQLNNKLVSIPEYAELCGVDRSSIRDRIKHKSLTVELMKLPNGRTAQYVDIEKYPPVRKK